MKLRKLLATVGATFIACSDAFVAQLASRINPSTSLDMTKRKPSMKEKRKQRQMKQSGEQFQNPFANLPKSELDFKASSVSEELDTPQTIFDPTEASHKARELLKAQRASVDMLTKVRQCIEALPSEEIMAGLNNHGFFVIDNLLGDESIVEQLAVEAMQLHETGEMEIDMANLGSGEYTTAIKGGAEQYAKCPRLVEWTVATTKHVPDLITEPHLDSSVCMATLRTFDRKAFQASLNLLTGGEEVPETNQPFATIVSNPHDDKRRISLQYFILPEPWDISCGGNISFGYDTVASAKRDRLVIWKSDSTLVRKDVWKGNNDINLASCLELHLVEKASK